MRPDMILIKPDYINPGVFSCERIIGLRTATGSLVETFLDSSFVHGEGTLVEIYPFEQSSDTVLVQFGDQDGTRCWIDSSRVVEE